MVKISDYPNKTKILLLEITKSEKRQKIDTLTGTNKTFRCDVLPGIIGIKDRQVEGSPLYEKCEQQIENILSEMDEREIEVVTLQKEIDVIEMEVEQLKSAE